MASFFHLCDVHDMHITIEMYLHALHAYGCPIPTCNNFCSNNLCSFMSLRIMCPCLEDRITNGYHFVR